MVSIELDHIVAAGRGAVYCALSAVVVVVGHHARPPVRAVGDRARAKRAR